MAIISSLGLEQTWVHRYATHEVDGITYDTFLLAVSGVGGVFLGLYFNAVSTIASSIYSRTPHDIRALMLRDPRGRTYSRLVSSITALALLLLAGRIVGFHPYHTAAVVLGLLGGATVFAFARLGNRAFSFADPTVLTPVLERELHAWSSKATVGRYRASDPSFQNHYRRQASIAVSSLQDLVRISAHEEHLQGASLSQLSEAIVRSLLRYTALKHKIPPESKWFGERVQHKRWYLTSFPEIYTASATSTPLPTSVAPNPDWLEDALLDALHTALLSHLETGQYVEAGQVLAGLADAGLALGRRARSQLAMKWLDVFTSSILDHAVSVPAKGLTAQEGLLTLLDGLSAAAISVEVGLNRGITALDIDELIQKITREGAPRKSIYELNIPTPAIKALELFYEQLQDEEDAQLQVRTSPSFIAEVVLNSTASAFQDELTAYLQWLELWLGNTTIKLLSASRPLEATAVAFRGLEASAKLSHLVQNARPVIEGMAQRSRMGDDLVRPRWDWDGYLAAAARLRRQMAYQLAQAMPALASSPLPDTAPDYLGGSTYHLGEACFDALASGRFGDFCAWFPSYFQGIIANMIAVHNQLATKTQPAITAQWVSGPPTDLLELSGYALIFSELLNDSRPWDKVQEIWDAYMPGAEGQQLIPMMELALRAHSLLPQFNARDMVRDWHRRTSAILHKLPRAVGSLERLHQSSLIRQTSRGMIGDGLGKLVFVLKYLRTKPDYQSATFGVHPSEIADLENRLAQDSDPDEVTENFDTTEDDKPKTLWKRAKSFWDRRRGESK